MSTGWKVATDITSAPGSGIPVSGTKERLNDLSSSLVDLLGALGVRAAFGLTGGALARFFDALGGAPFPVVHCRHETSAAFAALEASLISGRPAVVFATTGPGLMNALTGLAAARGEGGHVILISAATAAATRGRGACQETSSHTVPLGVFHAGSLFHYAETIEHPSQMETAAARLAVGLAQPGGFVAHLAIPTPLQAAPVKHRLPMAVSVVGIGASLAGVETAAEVLKKGPFVIWAGFGARGASRELIALAEATGSPVMCSPRAKGTFPETHPLYLGVTGLGGHETVEAYFAERQPQNLLVLGTALGEPTSYWQQSLLPASTLVHVDLDPTVFGRGYPAFPTLGVQAEVGEFLRMLGQRLPAAASVGCTRPPGPARPLGPARPTRPTPTSAGPVRATALMDAVQRHIVDATDAPVFTESGNSFAWGNSLLRFDQPKRYRVSVGFGSMGHAAAGVVGAALVRHGKAVAILGDGSMLMANELSTAVSACAQAVWIIMNDHSYGMVRQGMEALGFVPPEMSIPETDFAGMARCMGGDGVMVQTEAELDGALVRAMEAKVPFVVDVRTDPNEAAPWLKRIQALILQGAEAKRRRT